MVKTIAVIVHAWTAIEKSAAPAVPQVARQGAAARRPSAPARVLVRQTTWPGFQTRRWRRQRMSPVMDRTAQA